MSMELTIATVTSHKKLSVDWLECETSHGTLMIYPGHAPLVGSLKKNSAIRIGLPTGGIETIMMTEALIQVDRHTITIIGA